MDLLKIIVAVVGAYLIGAIPSAYLMGRLNGFDIRAYGSGNVGATNLMRVLGRKWGLACLAFDIAKGFLPVALLFPFEWFADLLARADAAGLWLQLWPWLIGVCAILGHMFSPFLKFRGGKGVATSLGVALAIIPWAVLSVLILALLLIWLSGYVSLGSVVGAAVLPFLVLAYNINDGPWVKFGVALLLGLLIIFKHRANIRRLREGTEQRWTERIGRQSD